MRLSRAAVMGAAAALGLGTPLVAQEVDEAEWCRHSNGGDQARFCEVRSYTLTPTREPLEVDASPNGGVTVEGWDRNEIMVYARVSARASSEADAAQMARGVEVTIDDSEISSKGPRNRDRESWSVSFRIYAPRMSDLELETVNGGIRISGISGDLEFQTTNGGVRLTDLGGTVSGRTTNGSIRVELQGDQWSGSGLDVRATNGSVKIAIPEGYSAVLETGTVNGSMRSNFPLTVEGKLSKRELRATLGTGGPPIRAHTTNGSVELSRR